MGIGFGNEEVMKSRNSDLKIKSNSFLIEEERRRHSGWQKNEFIIWSYLEDPIRVEKSKNLLKTIPIDASLNALAFRLAIS